MGHECVIITSDSNRLAQVPQLDQAGVATAARWHDCVLAQDS
jgi:hypothetical protein